jgi:hypothetical protein
MTTLPFPRAQAFACLFFILPRSKSVADIFGGSNISCDGMIYYGRDLIDCAKQAGMTGPKIFSNFAQHFSVSRV